MARPANKALQPRVQPALCYGVSGDQLWQTFRHCCIGVWLSGKASGRVATSIALSDTLSFSFALSALYASNEGRRLVDGTLISQGITSAVVPFYASHHCHFMLQGTCGAYPTARVIPLVEAFPAGSAVFPSRTVDGLSPFGVAPPKGGTKSRFRDGRTRPWEYMLWLERSGTITSVWATNRELWISSQHYGFCGE